MNINKFHLKGNDTYSFHYLQRSQTGEIALFSGWCSIFQKTIDRWVMVQPQKPFWIIQTAYTYTFWH